MLMLMLMLEFQWIAHKSGLVTVLKYDGRSRSSHFTLDTRKGANGDCSFAHDDTKHQLDETREDQNIGIDVTETN